MNKTILISLCCTLGLGACASLPQVQSEQRIEDSIAIPQQWQTEQSEHSIRTGLLDLFEDPGLQRVVQLALDNNLDIQLALKQLEEAGLNADISQRNRLPTLSATLGGNRNRNSAEFTGNQFNTSLDVSWELDIWGRLAKLSEAQRASFEAQLENYERSRDSIAAQTMQTWFNLIANQQQLLTEQARLQSLATTQETIRERYLAGLGTLDDLDAARRNYAQTQSALLERKETLANTRRQLSLLLGQYPKAEIQTTLTGDTPLPELLTPPAAGIPADTLSQRPDLRAAWQQVISADATTSASYRSLFPSINLTGSLGKQSSDFSDLMDSPTIWSLGSSLTAPLFNAGRLKKQYKLSQNQAEQAYIRYLNAALTAFQEVESSLSLENNLYEREQALDQALQFAKRTYNNARQDYQRGNITILNLLDAQLAVFDAESALISIRNARLQNRITFSLALGQGV